MIRLIKKLVTEEQAMETLEYAVMLALLALALVTALTALAASISGRFGETTTLVDSVD